MTKSLSFLSLAFAVVSFAFVSCIKDEAPNAECDITAAWLEFSDAEPSTYFYNESDAKASIPGSLNSENIVFQNMREQYDEVNATLHLTHTEASKLYVVNDDHSLTEIDGSITCKFSVSTPIEFFVIAEDEINSVGTPNYNKLIAMSPANVDRHVRHYSVEICHPQCETVFHFENFYLEEKGKYYEWSDPIADGNMRSKPNWGTANGGFGLARSSARTEEYPTIPADGGVSGKCVKLETCSTGSFGAMTKKPLAAGNLFLGEFDLKTALQSPLTSTRFGVTFNKYPERLTGYYKFSPGEVMKNVKGEVLNEEDTPAIYAVLYYNHDAEGNPVMLNGATVDDSPLIVARAEVPFFKKNTTDWQSFDVPFVFYKEIDIELLHNNGYNLAIVCSSSSGGATYTGAVGSKLFVDEFEIVCKE